MARALIILNSQMDREKASQWLNAAPWGMRIEFKEAKRSTEQNARMWAMLSDIAGQKTHLGQKYSTEVWKCLFMSALGQETKFVPALDGKSVVPILHRSSDLSKGEMTDLIELMMSWGCENGVTFHDNIERAA